MKRIILEPITQERSVITNDEMKHIYGGSGDGDSGCTDSCTSADLGKCCNGKLPGTSVVAQGSCYTNGNGFYCALPLESGSNP